MNESIQHFKNPVIHLTNAFVSTYSVRNCSTTSEEYKIELPLSIQDSVSHFYCLSWMTGLNADIRATI